MEYKTVFIDVAATLIPVFLLVLAGFFYGRQYRPTMDAVNALNFRVFIPALVFNGLIDKSFILSSYSTLMLSGALVVLISGAIAWVVSCNAGISRSVFIPSMMFNNSGNLGLPVALLAFGEPGLQAALVVFLVSNFLHFTLGVYLSGGSFSPIKILINPVNVALFLGLLFSQMNWVLPQPVGLPIQMASQVAIPLMLIALGIRMASASLDKLKVGLLGAVTRPLAGLIAVFAILSVFNLPELHTKVLILFSVLPPAVLNFMFAEKYLGGSDEVASIVIIGNLISVMVLYVTLLFIM